MSSSPWSSIRPHPPEPREGRYSEPPESMAESDRSSQSRTYRSRSIPRRPLQMRRSSHGNFLVRSGRNSSNVDTLPLYRPSPSDSDGLPPPYEQIQAETCQGRRAGYSRTSGGFLNVRGRSRSPVSDHLQENLAPMAARLYPNSFNGRTDTNILHGIRRRCSTNHPGDAAASWRSETEMRLRQCSGDGNRAATASRNSTTTSNHPVPDQDVSIYNIASTLRIPSVTESPTNARPTLTQRAERIRRFFCMRSESESPPDSTTPEGYRGTRDVGIFAAHNIRRTLRRGLRGVASHSSSLNMQHASPQEQTEPNVVDSSPLHQSNHPSSHQPAAGNNHPSPYQPAAGNNHRSPHRPAAGNNPPPTPRVVRRHGFCPPHVGCSRCRWCLHHGHCRELGFCRHDRHSTYHGDCMHIGPCRSGEADDQDCPIDREVTNIQNLLASSSSNGGASRVHNLQQETTNARPTLRTTARTTAARIGRPSSQDELSHSQEQLTRWVNPQQAAVAAGANGTTNRQALNSQNNPSFHEQMPRRSANAHRQLISNLRDDIEHRLRLIDEISSGSFREPRAMTEGDYDRELLISASADGHSREASRSCDL